MSLTAPSTQNISDTIVAQMSSSFGQTIPFLPKSFIRVLAKALAGVAVLLYKYCGFIFLQLFVAYASFDTTTINGQPMSPLTEWGRLIGIGDPLASTQAQHSISVVVKNQVGTLPANTVLVFPASGVIYQTVSVVALNAPTVTVTIRANSDQTGGDGSGAIGNLQIGDVVEFANTPANVAGSASVTAQLVTGADAETPDAYRSLIIRRFQSIPQGGAQDDYVGWSEDAPGIVAVYPYPGPPGYVFVYCEADTVSSGSADGIPTPSQLAAVSAAIEAVDATTGRATLRPVNAAVEVFPITRTGFGIQVFSLDPNTPDLQTAIATGVDQYLRTLEPFIAGVSPGTRKDTITQAAVGSVVNNIAAAAGASVASVTLLENGAPLTNRQLRPGEKAKLGSAPTYSHS